jgi:ubiquinone/menaquinone biosynthesis C-methylase UbiE
MNEHELAKAKAALTYNTAADYFDHPVSSFWHCFGRQTIERINLRAGESVLDVCSGCGGLAQAKAESRKLENIEYGFHVEHAFFMRTGRPSN